MPTKTKMSDEKSAAGRTESEPVGETQVQGLKTEATGSSKISQAIKFLVSRDGGLVASMGRLAEILEVHRTAPSGWAASKSNKKCTAEHAWMLAALIWNPEDNQATEKLNEVKALLEESSGWDSGSWNIDYAREKLETLRIGLLSRIREKDNPNDPRKLAYDVNKIAEKAGLGGDQKRVLKMAANYLSQQWVIPTISERLLTSASSLSVRIFLGQDTKALNDIFQTDTVVDYIGKDIFRRSVVNSTTNVKLYIVKPNDWPLDSAESTFEDNVKLFSQKIVASANSNGFKLGGKRTFEVRLAERKMCEEHLGDFWVFTTPADSPMFSVLFNQDPVLHAQVDNAFGEHGIDRKNVLYYSAESIAASTKMVRLLLARYEILGNSKEYIFNYKDPDESTWDSETLPEHFKIIDLNPNIN